MKVTEFDTQIKVTEPLRFEEQLHVIPIIVTEKRESPPIKVKVIDLIPPTTPFVANSSLFGEVTEQSDVKIVEKIDPIFNYHETEFPLSSKNLRALSQKLQREPESSTTGSNYASYVTYICHTPVLPGKFDPEKAVALGVKRGPQFGQLTKGLSVLTEAGNTVFPNDCISPPRPGPVFIYVSCPHTLR